jgi:hypothetical protein
VTISGAVTSKSQQPRSSKAAKVELPSATAQVDAVDTAAVDTATVDTAAVDTAAVDTAAVDTAAVDTAAAAGVSLKQEDSAQDDAATCHSPQTALLIAASHPTDETSAAEHSQAAKH